MQILQATILEWVAMPSSGDLPNPGIKPRSPTLQADSFPSEPSGNPKNTRVESLSLLQGNFPTQESNRGLLHCRWILYQLSYQGSMIKKQQQKSFRSLKSIHTFAHLYIEQVIAHQNHLAGTSFKYKVRAIQPAFHVFEHCIITVTVLSITFTALLT